MKFKSSSASIRKTLIAKRKCLSDIESRIKSKLICRNLLKTNWFQRSQHIAFYIAVNGEVDCSSLIEIAWKTKKYCYLPVLHPLKHNQLWFLRFTPNTKMQYNQYGTLEPIVKSRQFILPWMLD